MGVLVGVGSTNPVKREATSAALGRASGGRLGPVERVDAVAVASGVSEQPRGHEETVTGAETRARRALAAGDYDLGVGVEGGVATRDAAAGLWLVMWAAVTDGDRVGRGAGPSVRLPAGIADRVRDGAELGPVMDAALGTEGLARGEGAAGALTAGAMDRASALQHAVAGALGPFVTDHYGGD